MKNWEYFVDGIDGYEREARNKSDHVEFIGEDSVAFAQRVKRELDGCKVFSLNDDVKELLLKTEGTKDIDKLPFDKIFIDAGFDVSEFNEEQFGCKMLKITGLLVVKATEFVASRIEEGVSIENEKVSKIKGDGFTIYVLAWDDKNGVGFHNFQIIDRLNVFQDDHLIGGARVMAKKIKNHCISFVSNFLNMINNPVDIEYITKEYSVGKNKQRERQGKIRVPNTTIICPVGELRRYISDLKSDGHIDYSHKFWVRGHWRTLRDEERYGSKVGTKMWIKPFIKGKGILIDKKYEVKKKEIGDENNEINL